jgi:hypothetical protein
VFIQVRASSSCAPGGNRTPDRRIRRPLLYPLSYWGTAGVPSGCCRGRLKKFTVPWGPPLSACPRAEPRPWFST